MSTSLSKNTTGFTLIELLAAMAILLLLMGIVFAIFNQASKAWVLGENRTDTFQGARLAMEMVTRELEGAIATNNSPTAPTPAQRITFLTVKDATDLTKAYNGTPASLAATPPNDQIFFVSSVSNSAKRDDADLTEYGYFVVFCTADTVGLNAGRYYLLRQQTRSQSTDWDYLFSDPLAWPSKTQISASSKTPILENVLRLNLTYEKPQGVGTTEVTDWATDPDNPTQDKLPLAVHITMSVLDARAAARLAAIRPTGLTPAELALVPYQIEDPSLNEGIKNTLRDSLRTFYRTVYLRPSR